MPNSERGNLHQGGSSFAGALGVKAGIGAKSARISSGAAGLEADDNRDKRHERSSSRASSTGIGRDIKSIIERIVN